LLKLTCQVATLRVKPTQSQSNRDSSLDATKPKPVASSDTPDQNATPKLGVGKSVTAKSKQLSTKPGLGQATQLQLLTLGLLVLIVGLLMGVFVRLLTIKSEQSVAEQPLPVTNSPERSSTDVSQPNSNLGSAPEKITRDRFNQIQNGMTLKQVEQIVGSPGKLIADSSTADETGQVYSWKNPQGSNAIIEFKNGKVVAKAQAGL
jgi:hypothetical protein